ncbi:hypothetical protein AB0P17_07585 [Streptomyces sp. NPDC088124]|uniref:hypothetical protein n=1 Tax=Streptomyces sp. NPDC088124 TaxID=3154654 RepID=UPI00341ED5CD
MTTEQAHTRDRNLNDLFATIWRRFASAELRRRMRDYVRAPLAPVARKKGEHRTQAANDILKAAASCFTAELDRPLTRS